MVQYKLTKSGWRYYDILKTIDGLKDSKLSQLVRLLSDGPTKTEVLSNKLYGTWIVSNRRKNKALNYLLQAAKTREYITEVHEQSKVSYIFPRHMDRFFSSMD